MKVLSQLRNPVVSETAAKMKTSIKSNIINNHNNNNSKLGVVGRTETKNI